MLRAPSTMDSRLEYIYYVGMSEVLTLTKEECCSRERVFESFCDIICLQETKRRNLYIYDAYQKYLSSFLSLSYFPLLVLPVGLL